MDFSGSIKRNFDYRSSLILILLVLLASLGIIVLNYYTIKILSATRVYATGAANYVIAEKEAVRALIQFIETENPAYYDEFARELNVTISNGRFRAETESGSVSANSYKNWLQGRNQAEDFEDGVFLLQKFKNLSFVKNALKDWQEADIYVKQISDRAKLAKTQIRNNALSALQKKATIDDINAISTELSKRERTFSRTMGDLNRLLKKVLLWLNGIMALLIIGSVGTYAAIMINRITRSKQEVEELSRVKDQFLTVASHELKTPITTMKASLQIMERITSQETHLQQLNLLITKANVQVSRLTSIVNDLLDVSKIKAEQLQITKNYFRIEEAIKAAIEQVSPTANSYIEIKGDLSLIVYADKERIEQVLINFLSNAIKYSPNQKRIVILSENLGNELKVSISDSGVGIPESKIKRVFDRFFRVQEISDKFSGLGIGLYISSEIIKKHRGQIGVSSELNKGSTFWFKIPLTAPNE